MAERFNFRSRAFEQAADSLKSLFLAWIGIAVRRDEVADRRNRPRAPARIVGQDLRNCDDCLLFVKAQERRLPPNDRFHLRQGHALVFGGGVPERVASFNPPSKRSLGLNTQRTSLSLLARTAGDFYRVRKSHRLARETFTLKCDILV